MSITAGSLYRFWGALCGWATVYLALGALAGFSVNKPFAVDTGCRPYLSESGTIISRCDNHAVDMMWKIALGIPRFVLVPPAIAEAHIEKAYANNWDKKYLLGAGWWLMISLPLLLVVMGGANYWSMHSPKFALLLVLVIFAEIAAFCAIR